MPTLNQVSSNTSTRPGSAGTIHLLLVGETKLGKSHYVAQTVKAGYECLYVDADNGYQTLMKELNESERERVHYFNPDNFAGFVDDLLTRPVFRYNVTKKASFESGLASPDDIMVEIQAAKIPRNVILSLDSWTTLAYSEMKNAAAKIKQDITSIDKYSREIYQPSGYHLTQYAQVLQFAPFHVIVQAHPGVYERKEKPAGIVSEVKEKDMIIIETVTIPLSSSMPHSFTMGKHFNEIGYLSVDRGGARKLDFKTMKGRVGGGYKQGIGDPMGEYSFVNLYGKPPTDCAPLESWMKQMTAAEFKASMASSSSSNAAILKTSQPSPTTPVAPAQAGGLKLGGIKLKL